MKYIKKSVGNFMINNPEDVLTIKNALNDWHKTVQLIYPFY